MQNAAQVKATKYLYEQGGVKFPRPAFGITLVSDLLIPYILDIQRRWGPFMSATGLQKIAYALLLVVLFGVSTGWLGWL